MTVDPIYSLDDLKTLLETKHANEPEFHQAVLEISEHLLPVIEQRPKWQEARILDRLIEPDRVISFRVTWLDDENRVQINRGYRVQTSNDIGPYKGGLRFDPSVNLSVLKFLAFEQTFKNSLTGLPMGSGKGGADFDPKGKSDREVMHFCQAFMTELARHIGVDTDIPAGDIGVGAREIGYLFGQYKKIENRADSVLTGKELSYGGSNIRPEATGYGVVYMANEVVRQQGTNLDGKRCAVSGAGNVALYCAEKLLNGGATVVSLSDSDGTLYAPDGITEHHLQAIMEAKFEQRARLATVAEQHEELQFHAQQRPWSLDCELAFPCATQNELDVDDARALADNGCRYVIEGANMPTTVAAAKHMAATGVTLVPGKAANAGGVAVSGLELTQNRMRMPWSRTRVDGELQDLMKRVHEQCVEHGTGEDGQVDYARGANVAGFRKVAAAMLAQGI
ncbi:MAG: NADP-specific glutamate dehydrogenase [Pseudomonadota bacterium]